MVTDISVGRVEVTFLSIGTVLQQWKSGKVKVLAINSRDRYTGLDLPAITEDLPKLQLLANWMGVIAPAGLPPDITQRLHKTLVGVIQSADFQKRLSSLYWTPVGNRPEEFSAQLRGEYGVLAQVVKSAGLVPE